ncbi:MAG: hypothetical protein HYU99_06660 [Deltaproteobacteria bacterium]|nr:hypothetical protein [Deltaproteobacteria bacterium]
MLKIGAPPYINTLPLVRYLTQTVVFGAPRELEEKMGAGELDVALLPIFSFFKNPSWQAAYEAGVIQSCGPVESVALFYRENLRHPSGIKSIKYSEESVTSIALFKVIYSVFWKRDLIHLDPRSTPARWQFGGIHDSLLYIGDKALFFNEPGYKRLDLGEEWTKQTGLPFVYAAWISRKPLSREMLGVLIAAKNEGLAKREEIVRSLHDLPLDRTRCYLTKSIQYDITLKSLEGMEKFQDLSFEIGLLKEKRKL